MNAAPTPSMISVHMFGLRLRPMRCRARKTDVRTTTRPARRATARSTASGSDPPRCTGSPICWPMVITTSGIARAVPILKRRMKSRSSGLGPASTAGTPIGSRAMPQMGHVPGSREQSRDPSGTCIWCQRAQPWPRRRPPSPWPPDRESARARRGSAPCSVDCRNRRLCRHVQPCAWRSRCRRSCRRRDR